MSIATNATAATLAQARRFTVTKKARIEFAAHGMRCVIDEHGVARVPELTAAPGFVLSDEFERAEEYHVEQAGLRRRVTREELAAMVGSAKPAAQHHDEDE